VVIVAAALEYLYLPEHGDDLAEIFGLRLKNVLQIFHVPFGDELLTHVSKSFVDQALRVY
jgi:hypothetical protein